MASSNRTSDAEPGAALISVRNIGGIERCEVTVEPGVSILTGRNATNRTSLLSAIGGALGGSTASLKSDENEGHATLEFDGEVYTREYSRTGGTVQTGGTPYVDDVTLVDHFVALFEDNPVRQAVERGDPLREVIMRPVDTAAIEARIEELRAENGAIEAELETVESRRADLPELEERRGTLEAEIQEIDGELAALRDEVATAEADAAAAEAAADILEALNQRRQELGRLEDRLEVKRAERDALQDDRRELESAVDELDGGHPDDAESIEDELASARERKRHLDETISSLTTIVEFNADLLSDDVDLAGIDRETVDVTAELAPADERDLVCWTCGSEVDGAAIRTRLDDLRAVIEEKHQARREVEGRIEELEARRVEIDRGRSRKADLERQLEATLEKLSATEDQIESLDGRLAEAADAVNDLEERAAETEELRESDLPETYERIADLQYERGQRTQQLENVAADIREIEALPDLETLEAQREEITSELEQERARIDDLESSAVDAFNEHMDELLELLEYDNVSRVWLERKRGTAADGPGDADGSFELHVVRTSSDGAGYEDELSTLSESEREVVGLVVALAGYLVHEVHERVPFVLLDSLEAIDAGRIAAVVAYFADYAPYLVVALLPEDASALDEVYDRVPADALTT